MSKLKVGTGHPSASTQRSHPHGDPNAGKTGVQLENTFKLEPDDTFPSAPIKKIIVETLQDQLGGAEYSAEMAASKSKECADKIKQKVKAMGFTRHKIVSVVTIVENRQAAVTMGSRCVWNDKFDNYADAEYKNNNFIAVGCLYGLYCE